MVSSHGFQNVLKSPEASADVIENAVQNNLYAVFVKLFADLCKVLICAKAQSILR